MKSVGKFTKDSAQQWLEQNFPKQFEIIDFGKSGNQKSIFVDLKRNVKFVKRFNHVKRLLEKDPNYLFAATPEELKNKRAKTNLERYGSEFTLSKQSAFRSVYENQMIDQYGIVNVGSLPENRKKATQTRINKGQIKLIEGKTISQLSIEKNISPSHLNWLERNYGPDFILNFEKYESSLEFKIKQFFLEKLANEEIICGKKLEEFFPDFLIENKKLIIECDGLYWHSEKQNSDYRYHQKKKQKYDKLGYQSLFFRENEINEKFPIVQSIIKNKLGLSQRIFARKCEVKEMSKEEAKKFFEENHLMGKGKGDAFGLFYKNDLICMFQICLRNKIQNIFEISRFCCKLNYSVVGGFSKLLKFIIQKIEPNEIFTMIDRRYGSGEYLKNLGFVKTNEDVSFKWTNFSQVCHRKKMNDKQAKENKFYKIWDCGQAKYVLKLK